MELKDLFFQLLEIRQVYMIILDGIERYIVVVKKSIWPRAFDNPWWNWKEEVAELLLSNKNEW